MNSNEPPYRASLEHALALRHAAVTPCAAPEPAPIDYGQRGMWINRVGALEAQLLATEPDWEALATATQIGRLGRLCQLGQLGERGGRIPNQVFIPTRGASPITARFFAALAASDLDDWGCTIFDTGLPDADAARLAAFFKANGIEMSMYRGTSMDIASPKYCALLWGGAPQYMLPINDDTIPTPGFCQQLARAMALNPRVKLLNAASNTPLDATIYRAGFESGPDDTLLERVWNFSALRKAQFGDTVSRCVFSSFTCALVDWDAWLASMPMPTPFDGGHHFDIHCGMCLLQAGHWLGIAEGCSIFHLGHATYRLHTPNEIYDTVFERTRRLIDVWGHRPELQEIMHALLVASTNFSHH